MCRRCYNCARQACRSVAPRALLQLIRSSQEARDEWDRALANWDMKASAGVTRVRLNPAGVSRARAVERRVEEAPFRWVLETDYQAVFGRTAQEDGCVPQWEEINGRWEWGHRIYELDPRMRRITDSRFDTVQLGQQLDVGTEDGGGSCDRAN